MRPVRPGPPGLHVRLRRRGTALILDARGPRYGYAFAAVCGLAAVCGVAAVAVYVGGHRTVSAAAPAAG